ncbi:chorismate mutase [Pukyongiella litopenaei]|uniref:chorismate mutase n=1 Tax=Pukyongiella litopenaei TaxID=2605946 RepID=A0A2S0MUR2_9RHOB|nr:chorismate mutase [Pukyongiella litopenaei]AVO39634.1 chorismate mutase [Pukyongiella litopenaei]
MSTLTAPRDCPTMQALRTQIDRLDKDLVAMLALRARYIDRAAELKPGEGLPANIPDRVDAVLDNVRASADGAGLDPDLAEQVWRLLIGWAIERETVAMGHG